MDSIVPEGAVHQQVYPGYSHGFLLAFLHQRQCVLGRSHIQEPLTFPSYADPLVLSLTLIVPWEAGIL